MDNSDKWVKRLFGDDAGAGARRVRTQSLDGLRKERGITQVELGKKIGKSAMRVSAIEQKGKSQLFQSVEEHLEALGGRMRVFVEFDDWPAAEITDSILNRVEKMQMDSTNVEADQKVRS